MTDDVAQAMAKTIDNFAGQIADLREEKAKYATKLHRVRGFVTSYKGSHIGKMTAQEVKDEICDAVLDIIQNAGESE
jgi:hypothetical protein